MNFNSEFDNEYNSSSDSEFDSEFNSEFDSEFDSELDSGFDSDNGSDNKGAAASDFSHSDDIMRDLERELTRLTVENNELNDIIKEKDEKIKQLEESGGAGFYNYEDEDDDSANYEEQLFEKERELDELKGQCARKDKELEKLRAEISNLKINSAELNAEEVSADTAEYEERLRVKDDEIQALKDKNLSLGEENSRLNDEIEALKTEYNSAKANEEPAPVSDTAEELKAELDKKESRITELEEEVESLRASGSESGGDNSSLIRVKDKKISELNEDIERLEAGKRKLSRTIDDLQENLGSADEKLRKYKKQAQEFEAQFEDVNSENRRLKRSLSETSESKEESDRQLSLQRDKYNELLREKERLENKNRELDSQLRKIVTENMFSQTHQQQPYERAAEKQFVPKQEPQTDFEAAAADETMSEFSFNYIEEAYKDYFNNRSVLPQNFREIKLACRGFKPKLDDERGLLFYIVKAGGKTYLYPSVQIASKKYASEYSPRVFNCVLKGRSKFIEPAVVSEEPGGAFIRIEKPGKLEY